MKRILAIGILAIVMMSFAGCGGGAADGGSPADGGWLAKGNGEVYYLEIKNGTGPVDYAFLFGGQLRRDHGEAVIHNDGTIEVDGFVDGDLKDCSACPYKLSGNNLVINYTYQPYNGQGPVSGTMTLSPSDAATYQSDVQALNP